jgi:hypothetical protein
MADDAYNPANDPPLPKANDPGGAHRKGYSADPGPVPAAPDQDPVPLADEAGGHVRKPDDDPALPATGRSEPKAYSPNDRVMGSDR